MTGDDLPALIGRFGLDATATDLQILRATSLLRQAELSRGEPLHRPGFSSQLPLLVHGIPAIRELQAIADYLSLYYPDQQIVQLLDGSHQVVSVSLSELACRKLVWPAAVLLPALLEQDGLAEFSGLRWVVARLRAPDGCPWDREQSHESLKPYLIEEAYEVLDAIDSGSDEKMVEELGDLILQVVLHAQLGEEAGAYRLEDVFEAINAKLIRRHPHVFGEVEVSGSGDVLRNWQQIKRDEKQGKEKAASLLGDIPRYLPALSQALTLQKRAARSGFDWSSELGVEEKLQEELAEFAAAGSEQQQCDELGDVLFSLVNLARWRKIDPEEALRQANARFRRRFASMERRCSDQGREFCNCSAEEMDQLWLAAKAEE